MALIQFVRNYDDMSSDKGYQFRFNCDKCGNGYVSAFQPSMIGTAGSVLKVAGRMFGGDWAREAGNSSYELQRAVGGKAHDAAMAEAVQLAKTHFHQCTRCGHWVCPESCWNAQANMCDQCAPKWDQELASAQAQAKSEAMRSQMFQSARNYDYATGVDMSANSVLSGSSSPSPWETQPAAATQSHPCANCGADVGSAKFCPECGSPAASAAASCGRCGFKPTSPTKFCPECGNHL
jgi:membrane protease subunit (stomatin/prohibitin family)